MRRKLWIPGPASTDQYGPPASGRARRSSNSPTGPGGGPADYEQVDGQPVVRFERTFPHPVGAVWEAVSDPAQLETWFPTTVEFAELAPGAPIRFRFAEDRYPLMSGGRLYLVKY